MGEALLSDNPALRIYLNQACDHKVLNFEEEQKLAKEFVKYRDMENRNSDQIKRYWELREEFILHNLKLVVHIAKKYKRRSPQVELVDIISEGNIGLMSAIRKFNPALGFRFGTYAVQWIRQAIEKRLRYKATLIKIPSNKVNRLRKLQKDMKQEALTAEDVARKVNLTKDEVSVMNLMYKPMLDTSDLHKEDEIEAAIYTEEDIERELISRDVRRAISLLRPVYKEIIKLRFGLCEDKKEYSFGEISKKLGCSKQWAHHLEKQGLKILESILTHNAS